MFRSSVAKTPTLEPRPFSPECGKGLSLVCSQGKTGKGISATHVRFTKGERSSMTHWSQIHGEPVIYNLTDKLDESHHGEYKCEAAINAYGAGKSTSVETVIVEGCEGNSM